jgi:thioredoxin 1
MSALPDVTESTFPVLVLGSDKPVLVDFWAPWCGPCRMLSPIVEKVSKDMGDRVRFLKMNTDENPSTAGKYGISGIPALLLYKGGEVVDRIVGFVPEQQVRQFLDKHLAAA